MKVLLFVQNGDGRPKCVGRAVLFPRSGYRPRYRRHLAIGPPPSPGYPQCHWWTDFGPGAAAAHADSWWLVECENADLGRMAITTQTEQFGRILASGGRAE